MVNILSKTDGFYSNFDRQAHKLRTWVSVCDDYKSAHVSFKPLIVRSPSSSYFSGFYGRRVVMTGSLNARKAAGGACNSQVCYVLLFLCIMYYVCMCFLIVLSQSQFCNLYFTHGKYVCVSRQIV